MNGVLLAALSAAAAWAALAVLCLRSTTQRHRMGLPEQTAMRRRLCGAAGGLLLLASLVAAVASDGPAVGAMVWLCQLGLLGLALIFLLPYRPGIVLWRWRWAGTGSRHSRE